MSHGFGKKSVKKHCLRVNEQGFISLYAMLLLLIFLCFVTLLVQRAAAYAAVRGLQESYDLFAIHSCRRYLQETLKPDADAEAEGMGGAVSKHILSFHKRGGAYRCDLYAKKQYRAYADIL